MSLEQQPAPNIYFDPRFGVQAAKILPGEFYISTREMLLVTVLGSCVAACIWDTKLHIGGMNHFMLPDLAQDKKEIAGESGRYGVYAMELLINQLIKLGARKNHLRAKVFGGGNVIKGFQSFDVGIRNAQFVKNFLNTERIPIEAEDLLDIWPRKVYFFSQSGRVLVKKLRSLQNDTIFKREIEYRTKLCNTDISGDVQLF